MKIYIVVNEDRHSDINIKVFEHKLEAIKYYDMILGYYLSSYSKEDLIGNKDELGDQELNKYQIEDHYVKFAYTIIEDDKLWVQEKELI